jgi:hypothetical protein
VSFRWISDRQRLNLSCLYPPVRQTEVCRTLGLQVPRGTVSLFLAVQLFSYWSRGCVYHQVVPGVIFGSHESRNGLAAMTMHKQFWAITIVAVALLFSQGGSVLVASLCPHLQSATPSCGSQLIASAMAHGSIEHIEHMDMRSMEHAPAISQDANAVAFGQPASTCPHCAVHSRTAPNAVSLKGSEASRRFDDSIVPLQFSRVVRATVAPFRLPVSRAHGPPGSTIARYVLINTFRI